MNLPAIFISYSHLDRRDKDRLVKQIEVLERVGKLDLWSDERIKAGENWKSEIDKAMAMSEVAILIVTANFLTSNFILDVEVPELLKRHQVAGLDIFPVIARDCAWQEVPWLAEMNVKPIDGKPVWRSGGRYAEQELAQIARDVAAAVRARKTNTAGKKSSKLAIPTMRSKSRPDLTKSIEAIDKVIEEMLMATEYFDVLDLDKIVHEAISSGVSLYNQGRVVECAEIYTYTVKRLIEIIESSPYGQVISTIRKMMSSRQELDDSEFDTLYDRDAGVEAAYEALKDLSDLPLISNRNGSRVAWKIRHALDQIRFLASAIRAMKMGLSPFGRVIDQFGPTVETVLNLAISQSDLIYEQGLARKKRWIKTCVAIYLYTAREIYSRLQMTELPNETTFKLSDVVFDEMENIDTLSTVITDKNAYELAWNIRHSFERLLDLIEDE